MQSISQAKKVFGDKIDIEYETFIYGKDESLVIYRSSSKYLAHSLLPFRQAQALHPAPYPDEVGRPNELESDWKKQIYYAWWNGYILGYPDHFIDSYCESFHNGLGLDDKLKEVAKAKRVTSLYFSELDSYNRAFKSCMDSRSNDLNYCSTTLSGKIDNKKAGESTDLSRNAKTIVQDGYNLIARNPNLTIKYEHAYIGFRNSFGGPLNGDFWKFINY